MTTVTTPTVATPTVAKKTRKTSSEKNSSDSSLSSLELGDSGMIPKKDKLYVRLPFFSELKKILAPAAPFLPIYITGPTRNGKTYTVFQVAASLNLPIIRANITTLTDEDDLLGSFQLQNGETIWVDGPVVRAMKIGAILLLDEIDLASEKILCLQPILEGSGLYVKRTNKWVYPHPNFRIVATANTKGNGCFDGDGSSAYIGCNQLNEAFLERFAVTIVTGYPPPKIEEEIVRLRLGRICSGSGEGSSSKETSKETKEKENGDGDFSPEISELASSLVQWAGLTRQLKSSGDAEVCITTGRLVHIADMIGAGIFNPKKAIEFACGRFDADAKDALLKAWNTVTKTPDPEKDSGVNAD
jgi:MoxR-like ATPase